MMKKMMVSSLWGLSALAAADTISTAPVELNIATGTEPVCYFEDKRYSKGSVINMGEQWFVCEREKSFERNGRLSWHPFEPAADQRRD